MTLILGNGHSDGPTTQGKNGNKEIGRACANYHPSVWGDCFIASSLTDKELDPCTKQRAEKLKEEVKKILSDVNNTVQKLNLIDAIQCLGVAYHFETDIEKELHRIYDGYNGNGDNLHAVALQFGLLRQQGYNVSSGKFKGTLSSDIQGLLSLYEAAYLGIHGDDILDEAITFTTMHLKSALPHLTSPLAKQVELALEVPLRKRVERLQSRYYISIYEEDKERSDVLLEFAKLDFNILQSLHKKELRDISSWDRGEVDQLPEYMKIHFVALLDAVDGFEEELSREGKSYRISYLKEAYNGVARAYLKEARWASSDYVPTYEEYMEVALISSAYPMFTVISLVGMGDIVTKEALEWAINVPKVVTACSVICRLKDDLTSSELEQARGHVASAMQCYMRDHGTSYVDKCKNFQNMVASAWKEVNKECLKPSHVLMPVKMRVVNLARVIELLYVHQDGYTNSTRETKDRFTMVMVDPVAV